MTLEVCVDSVQAAIAAVDAGASRLELCAALDIGGVTPHPAFIEAVRAAVSCPLVVLVRPRAGNFVYDKVDAWQIRQTVALSSDLDIQGLAVGAVTDQGELDRDLLESLRQLRKRPIQWVMHRAFDFTDQPSIALEQLIEMGFDRILTSGGREGIAAKNVDRLRSFNQQAAGRITILPGGGIAAHNAASVLRESGCRELHGSFRSPGEVSSPQAHLFGGHRLVDSSAIGEVARLISEWTHPVRD